MHWQYTPYSLPLFAAALVCTALATYACKYRSTRGAPAFAVLMAGVALWSLASALETASAHLAAKLFWANLEYIGIVVVPTAWLVFGLQYSGHKQWLTRRNFLLLGLQPLAVLVLVWTNEMHGLFRAEVLLDTSGSFAVLGVRFGIGFWFHAVYSYLLLLLGTLTLVRNFMRASHLHRGQVSAVLFSALAPWLGNVLYLSGASPFPHLDLTPFAFTLTGLAVTLGLFRFHFLDITPIARDAIFEGIADGIIVLDKEDRIVDINPAAQNLIRRRASTVVGHSVAQVLTHLPALVDRIRKTAQDRVEILLGETGNWRKYELRISPLYDRGGHSVGRLVILHDIFAPSTRPSAATGETNDA